MEKYSFINENFEISQILESGQYFFYKKELDYYLLKINNEEIKIKTEKNKTTINKTEDYFNENLYYFFDMDTNYCKIIKEINEQFPELKKYTEFGKGVRFLKQDFLITSISFIISQNNNMKRIKNSIDILVEKYGINGNFPTLEKLKELTLEDFKNLGVGFRDKYLFAFIQDINESKINDLKKMNTVDAFNTLVKYNGIGPKVANCILLFGLNKRDVFPIDVHIKRIMQDIYFEEKEIPIKEIEVFALKKFKDKSSYIQQYLFYWAINHK